MRCAEHRWPAVVGRDMSRIAALALVSIVAGCRSAQPATSANDTAAANAASSASEPASEPDALCAVEVVRLQHVAADVLVAVLAPPPEQPPNVRWNENQYCVLRLPEGQLPPPEAPWTVVADPAQNAIVIRGTPEKVAALRTIALAIDRAHRAKAPRAP